MNKHVAIMRFLYKTNIINIMIIIFSKKKKIMIII